MSDKKTTEIAQSDDHWLFLDSVINECFANRESAEKFLTILARAKADDNRTKDALLAQNAGKDVQIWLSTDNLIDIQTFPSERRAKMKWVVFSREGFLKALYKNFNIVPDEASFSDNSPKYTLEQAIKAVADVRERLYGLSDALTEIRDHVGSAYLKGLNESIDRCIEATKKELYNLLSDSARS
jgi:hypothetical protein